MTLPGAPEHGERFSAGAARYAEARPDYPAGLIGDLVRTILAGPPGLVIDVGSGTGIFTRQLRAALPADVDLVGIEPSAAMRAQATARPTQPSIAFKAGAAEALPVEDRAARAVTAATAAHWFERTRFYAEAARVLAGDGLLAIVEYIRDETAPAPAVATAFLGRHGSPRGNSRPNYQAELSCLSAFANVSEASERVVLSLEPSAFTELVLSSSYARGALDTLGEDEARRILLAEARDLIGRDGLVPYPYVFRCFTARRRDWGDI
ncbi:MAG TPA: class I SAM-dependent methyltransferase [Bosea sp. (in: a-proteobacteria)]|uniref:class I SAM-dependent methyltransferase n=1 Tax=Bosea sp. (in: a-proteobacteria) TaxID=1871050 RepID=UPI002E12461B|nr:class I SAM-dependent methyltransferase [Bosea sp. (in: a-proteobacteria)]